MRRITYVGHGTVLIEVDGVTLLTDPLLRRWAGPLRRFAPAPDLGGLIRPDAVLLSHMHIDHVDRASLRLFDRSVRVLVPRVGERLLRRYGFAHVEGLAAGDRIRIGHTEVMAVPARHEGKRHPWADDGEAIGYTIGTRDAIYYAGDTASFPEMREIGCCIDTALLPVWGWGSKVDEDVHLTPLTAAHALEMLQPRLVIPVHWGTYGPPVTTSMRRFDAMQPPHAFARYAGHLAPHVEVRILQPGESTRLDDGSVSSVDASGEEPTP